jgi:hypothetical protein
MKELVESAAEIQSYILGNEWRFCFIGGIAFLRWGEPRLTQDVDLTLFTGFGNENYFIDCFLQKYAPRRDDMHEFARRNRVMLLKSDQGYPFDVALGALPYEKRMIDRGSYFKFSDQIDLYTCSAEDLIVLKSFASRKKDWVDIRTIIIRQATSLDWSIIFDELVPLVKAKEQPEILTQLEMMRTSGKNDVE